MRRGMLSLSLEGDSTIVELHGDLDIATAEPLRTVLHNLEGERSVVIDIADVPFCDSSGVAVIAAAAIQASSAGHALSIRGAHANVERVLRLTGCEWLLVGA